MAANPSYYGKLILYPDSGVKQPASAPVPIPVPESDFSTGFIYAPYIPLQITPTFFNPSDFRLLRRKDPLEQLVDAVENPTEDSDEAEL